MKSVSVFICIALWMGWGCAQFLNNRPFPTYSLENMPDTEFSCRDKILGGYYADVETMCQMFHICVKVAGVGVRDFRFLCPNGTAFDQDHQICAEWEDVDCDISTLYYSSDNFDLYRIGSGFESKAVKYGEDEETFALQRAESGDARLNREHQSHRVNQQKDVLSRKNRPQNNYNNNNNNNNDRDIFKGSSSSNFFNNRNGGKETDDDYDDNVNANQDNDRFQKRKLIRKQNRKPQQNDSQQYNNNNQQSRRPVQNDYQNGNNRQQQNINRQQNSRHQDNDNQNNNRQQNEYQNNNRQRPAQNNDNHGNRQNDYQNNGQNDYQSSRQNNFQNNRAQQQNFDAQTDKPQRPTGFTNNFAGSSYVPTTSRPTTTTTTTTTTTIRNHGRQFNGDRQYNNADTFRQTQNTNSASSSPVYTVSTPAPFKQTQQYNSPPNRGSTRRTYDDGQYRPSTTQQPRKETENYPANFPKQVYNKPTENYPSTAQKFTQKQTENYPTQSPVTRDQFNTHYDIPKVKSTETYATQPPVNRNNQFNNQFNSQKVKTTENYPTQAPVNRNTQYNNQFNSQKTQAPVSRNTQYDNQFNSPSNKPSENYPTQAPKVTQYNTQYDVPKINPSKNNDNYPTTAFKNDYSTQFNKKPTTPVKQQDNYPTTFAPKFNKSPNQETLQSNNNNYPSTFSPRNNPSYSPISQQTTQYNTQNTNNNYNQPQQHSTPRTTPFTQYTPTVPKISTTTPVTRSNRFDETSYDDGSYNSKYDRREDEFLKTAHSQNIASSRNEYVKTTKNVPPSTQRPQFESPRPFAASANTPKTTDYPKSTPRSVENSNNNNNNNAPTSSKKVKDASYDYAYYDTNVGSEPEYDIDTEIKKA